MDKNKMVRFRMIYDRPRLRGKYRKPIAKKLESIDLSKIIDCQNYFVTPNCYKCKIMSKINKICDYRHWISKII